MCVLIKMISYVCGKINVCYYVCPRSQKARGIVGLWMSACGSGPTLTLSQPLLSNFLKAHTILLASTASPLLCYLTCPNILQSTDGLLKRSHNGHLIASTMALPLIVFNVLVVLNVGGPQGYVLNPLLNFLSLLGQFHPSHRCKYKLCFGSSSIQSLAQLLSIRNEGMAVLIKG